MSTPGFAPLRGSTEHTLGSSPGFVRALTCCGVRAKTGTNSGATYRNPWTWPYSGLVYGSRAISRARLIAVVSARCCLAVSPVMRRGMIRPRSVMK
jgi:hypothetical protein